VTLDLGKRQHAITVGNMHKAADLIAFCNALGMLRGSGSMSPAVLGQTALSMIGLAGPGQELPMAMAVDDEGVPMARLADEDRPHRRGDHADGAVAPPKPERVAQPRSGIIAYSVIVVAAIASVFILKPLNEVWHDHAWFNLVKDKEPPELRAYLLDPLCTRHREQVTQLLADYYQPVLDRLANPSPEADPELAPEFVLLVKDLQGALQPLVSLAIKEGEQPGGGQDFNRAPEAERRLTDSLYNVFTYNRAADMHHVPGNKLVDTVKPPEDAKPIIEVIYRFERGKGPFNDSKLMWTVRLRHKVTQEEVKSKTWTVGGEWRPEQFQAAVEEGIRQTMIKLTGQAQWNP
jgi:hypothetical protein